MIGEIEARKLCEQVLKRCQGAEAELILIITDSALTRFANNVIHQNVAERDAQVSLRYFIGKQAGSAITNRTDAVGLDELVVRARANAQASPPDPDRATAGGRVCGVVRRNRGQGRRAWGARADGRASNHL